MNTRERKNKTKSIHNIAQPSRAGHTKSSMASRLVQFENDVWRFLIYQMEHGHVDMSDMACIFESLQHLHMASIRELFECAQDGDGNEMGFCFRYPSTGLPFVRFEVDAGNVIVRSINVCEIEVELCA